MAPFAAPKLLHRYDRFLEILRQFGRLVERIVSQRPLRVL
jgi:hypothetical protein